MSENKTFNELKAFLESGVVKSEGGDDKKPPKGFEKFFKKKEDREKEVSQKKGKNIKCVFLRLLTKIRMFVEEKKEEKKEEEERISEEEHDSGDKSGNKG